MSAQPAAAPAGDSTQTLSVSTCDDAIWCVEFPVGIETLARPDAQVAAILAGGTVTEANRTAALLHGAAQGEDLVGRWLGDVLGVTQPELSQFLRVFVTRGYHAVQPGHAVCLTGVVQDGRLVRICGVDHRVAVRRLVDGRLRQTQKLAAIGMVATGVAHDFNNLLTAILGYSEIVKETLGPDHASAADLEQVMSAGRRAEVLARQLLSFTRAQRQRTDVVDLNQLVTAFVPLLKRVVGDEIEIELSCEPGPAMVRADRGQLELVIMNLALNARDAMNGAGRLGIAVGPGPGASAGAPGWARLTVTDTGPSGVVAGDTPAPIFEPFFTTKASGSQLGLATVHDIVLEQGGSIDADRTADGGGRFVVRLPAAPADADHLERAAGTLCGGGSRR